MKENPFENIFRKNKEIFIAHNFSICLHIYMYAHELNEVPEGGGGEGKVARLKASCVRQWMAKSWTWPRVRGYGTKGANANGILYASWKTLSM